MIMKEGIPFYSIYWIFNGWTKFSSAYLKWVHRSIFPPDSLCLPPYFGPGIESWALCWRHIHFLSEHFKGTIQNDLNCSGQKSKCKQAAHEDASNCIRASSRHTCQHCPHSDSFWINATIVCILTLWAVGGPDNSHKLWCGLTLTYEVTTTSKHCHLHGCLEGFPGSVANRSSGKWTVNN